MKLGELCAGYGGLGMAVEEVFGAELAWVSEFDEAPSKILAHHWPNVPNHGDMTKIDWAAIEPVDIISGGTPCQDLSAAGRRAGMTEGTRSNLWVQMREAIATQRPKYVVWENVRGAFSAKANSDLEHCPRCMGETSNRGHGLRALGRVLGDLSDLGFDAEWRGVRASEVGACHQRYRVFVLAKNSDPAAWSERRIAAPGQAEGWRARTNAGGRSGTSAFADTESIGRPQGWAEPAGFEWGLHASLSSNPSAANPRGLHSERRGINNDLVSSARTSEVDGSERKRNGNAADCSVLADSGGEVLEWGDYEPSIRRWEGVTGRRAPRPTEPTGRAGAERLSPTFVEWMMGLPTGWVTEVPEVNRNGQLKALGNGVVPQQAVAALQDMLNAFKAEEIAA